MNATQNYSVVIVDDHQIVRQLVRKIAELEGFAFYEADNPEDGLLLLEKIQPNLAILDIRMHGDIDGYELCSYLKSSPLFTHTYVCLMTSLARKEDIARGQEVKSNAYLVKPFKLVDLKEIINESKKGSGARQIVKS